MDKIFMRVVSYRADLIISLKWNFINNFRNIADFKNLTDLDPISPKKHNKLTIILICNQEFNYTSLYN